MVDVHEAQLEATLGGERRQSRGEGQRIGAAGEGDDPTVAALRPLPLEETPQDVVEVGRGSANWVLVAVGGLEPPT